MNNYKKDFPIFTNLPDLVYLDSAATSQKPQSVIDAVSDFYATKNANIHRGIYHLADDATNAYEQTRDTVAKFINAKSSKEIIFSGNTNQSINLVAYGWARKSLKTGDIVVLSAMEHHANIVPWIRLHQEIGIELVYLPLTGDYRLDYPSLRGGGTTTRQSFSQNGIASHSLATTDLKKIKLIALTHASNVLGTINPIAEIVSFIRTLGIDAKVLIDGAQSVPHLPIDVQQLDIDFLAFSSHKMLGPAGVGVLWAKEELLQDMDPLFVGSHMINHVSKDTFTPADLPDKFEVGTGNLEGVVGLAAAVEYLQEVGLQKVFEHEQELTRYALKQFQTVPYVTLYGPTTSDNRLGIFSFGIDGVHPHDIAQILDRGHVAIRSGHHCAQVLMKCLHVTATARASVYLYNTKDDIDRLMEGIGMVKKTLKI